MRQQRPGVRLGTPHPWQTHGAYSLMRAVTKGELDGRGRYAAAIKAVCHQLAADLGASWSDLTAPQRFLCEQVAVKSVVLSLMAGYALAAESVLDGQGRLKPPLSSHYLAWSNSLRLDLQALGLERQEKRALDVAALLAAMPSSDAPGGYQESRQPQETAPGAAGEVLEGSGEAEAE